MAKTHDKLKQLIARIDRVLSDEILDDSEFQEFEKLILESLRAIMSILSEK
jgi:hypothetical protein